MTPQTKEVLNSYNLGKAWFDPRVLNLTGDMTNLYPFVQDLLE